MMLTTLVAAIALQAVNPLVNEYFPLNEGDTYEYEDKIGKGTFAMTIKIGAPTKGLNGQDLMPEIIETGTGEPQTLLYWPDGDAVKIYMQVAKQNKKNGSLEYDEDGKPVMTNEVVAYPVFKVTNKEVEWAYRGRTALQDGTASYDLNASAKYVGFREVLGKKRETILVKMRGTAGAQDGLPIINVTEAYYAKGIGLYQSHEVQQLGKRKAERVRRLVAYTPKAGN
ncbi:MAG: hypothetical protein JSS65_06520 [Armatimonadetes bacterium]|nr:hypothetical protein [Armatimonadota bacterium]